MEAWRVQLSPNGHHRSIGVYNGVAGVQGKAACVALVGSLHLSALEELVALLLLMYWGKGANGVKGVKHIIKGAKAKILWRGRVSEPRGARRGCVYGSAYPTCPALLLHVRHVGRLECLPNGIQLI